MIKTTAMLKNELKAYVNPMAKIRLLAKAGELVSVARGLYETDRSIPGYYLAPIIYGPSYLSFEFALAYYSLIPEAVYNFTSATFERKRQSNMRHHTVHSLIVMYQVKHAGITFHTENGYGFKIASPEKAICDELYKMSPLMNRSELEHMLFEDLRIDESDFFHLNMTIFLIHLAFIKRRITSCCRHISKGE